MGLLGALMTYLTQEGVRWSPAGDYGVESTWEVTPWPYDLIVHIGQAGEHDYVNIRAIGRKLGISRAEFGEDVYLRLLELLNRRNGELDVGFWTLIDGHIMFRHAYLASLAPPSDEVSLMLGIPFRELENFVPALVSLLGGAATVEEAYARVGSWVRD